MKSNYLNLTPEQTIEKSNLLLTLSQRIYGSNYVDDLSIRIEREQSILNRSIAMAKKSEFAHLLAAADGDFYRSYTLFTDLVHVKSLIHISHDEYKSSKKIFLRLNGVIEMWDRCSRKELIERVESIIQDLDSNDYGESLTQAGVMPLFNDLKSRFLVLTGLISESSQDCIDVPSPSIAGRRLAMTLCDLHTHVEGYSRLGNREYKMFLKEMNKPFEN